MSHRFSGEQVLGRVVSIQASTGQIPPSATPAVTPPEHAASHAPEGTDPITFPEPSLSDVAMDADAVTTVDDHDATFVLLYDGSAYKKITFANLKTALGL